MSVQVNMYYELLFMSESLLKSLNISYKARNTDLALPTFKLNPMWCACFTAISYWANSIQIWFITLHIYRFERSISVYWNEMKWRIYYKIYTEKEREREREREVPSEGSVVAVWAFEMSNDTRKKNKRQ